MDLPPTWDSRGGSMLPVADSESARELAGAREANRACCAADAARLRWVARIVKPCRGEVRERVLALRDTDLDVDAEVFAHRRCIDSVMVALGIGQSEATRLVHLADRLANLPEVWQAWSAGVLDASRVRVLADATEVLDDATARAVADQVLAWAGDGPWAGLAPRQWRTRVQEAVVRADAGAAARRRAAAVAARRVRSWAEGDGSAVLTVHAGKADIEMADQVISDLALFGDGPAADATAQLRGLGCPDAVDPVSARALVRRQLRDGIGVQVLVVDGTGAVQHVIRLDRDTARSCGSRETLLAAVRQAIADAPTWEVQGHDPSEAIARHVRAAAPTCSFYDCPRQARSCDLDHDTPWPRGPTSVTNLDPKCRRHHNAKTLGVARTRLTAGPGAGPRTVHWTLP